MTDLGPFGTLRPGQVDHVELPGAHRLVDVSHAGLLSHVHLRKEGVCRRMVISLVWLARLAENFSVIDLCECVSCFLFILLFVSTSGSSGRGQKALPKPRIVCDFL